MVLNMTISPLAINFHVHSCAPECVDALGDNGQVLDESKTVGK